MSLWILGIGAIVFLLVVPLLFGRDIGRNYRILGNYVVVALALIAVVVMIANWHAIAALPSHLAGSQAQHVAHAAHAKTVTTLRAAPASTSHKRAHSTAQAGASFLQSIGQVAIEALIALVGVAIVVLVALLLSARRKQDEVDEQPVRVECGKCGKLGNHKVYNFRHGGQRLAGYLCQLCARRNHATLAVPATASQQQKGA
jgi:hypothetical protein